MQINCVFSKIKTYVKLAGNEISDTINQISIQNWKKKKENYIWKDKTRSKKEIGKSYYRIEYRYICR